MLETTKSQVLYVYHHHSLARLAELLGALMQRSRGGAPLRPEQVIVPNQGVGRWLQGELAQSDGVAANIEFPLFATFAWQSLRPALALSPVAEGWFRDRMRWELFALLPDVADEVPAVARYLAGEPRELVMLQLAERLADVFDQYQVFRADLLAQWDRGGDGGVAASAAWQGDVWRALRVRLGPRHRALVLREMVSKLTGGPAALGPIDPRPLYVFATADLPPDYLRLLYALGRVRDVHLLLPNPSEAYWGDIRSTRLALRAPRPANLPAAERRVAEGHPLLAALGRPLRDCLHLLYADELAGIQEPELGAAMAYEPPQGGRLLERLQRGIITLSAGPDVNPPAPDDVSIQVHACHGVLREVQVLHDQLLDLLAAEPSLMPRDILVAMPDPSRYGPAIRSVFGGATGPRRIPWSLADQSRRAAHPLVQALRELCELPQSRWSGSEVLAFAAVAPVMRRFGLDETGLLTVTHWLQEAGVRWGLDADTRERLGAGRYDEHTWAFGLDRLLLGAMLDDPDALIEDVSPWTGLEGGATVLAGALTRLVQALARWQALLGEARPADQWRGALNAALQTFFAIDEDDRGEREAMVEIHAALEALDLAAAALGDTPLGWPVVREVLLAQLGRAGARQPYLSGGVTFGDLRSLAGVPFRVVCLLGMNDGEFPREDAGAGINLVLGEHRLGDRRNRDQDRLAFLQLMLAARDVFYVSYVGCDVRTGEKLEASTTVTEWLEFLRDHHCGGLSRDDFQARVVTRQPMQPFSPRYFASEAAHGRVFTFSGRWRAGAAASGVERTRPPRFDDGARLQAEPEATVTLESLQRFYRDPPAAFLRERLGLALGDDQTHGEDDEALALDGLAAWRLRSTLLARMAAGEALSGESPPRAWQRRALLPPPPLDQAAWREAMASVQSLHELQTHWHAPAPVPLDLDVALPDGRRLTGRLRDWRPGGLHRVHAGKLKMKRLLSGWIDLLALTAAGHEGALFIAGAPKKDDPEICVLQVTADDALPLLARLVEWYDEGQRGPLPFHADVSGKYATALLQVADELDLDAAERGVEAHGETGAAALLDLNRRLGESSDWSENELSRAREHPYFAPLLWPDTPLGATPGDTAFCAMSAAVCLPLLRRQQALSVEEGLSEFVHA